MLPTPHKLTILILIFALGLGFFTNRLYQYFFVTDVWTEGIVGHPRHIHPIYGRGQPVDEFLSKLLFRSPLVIDENNEYVGDLVERWEINDEKTVYTIRLKSGQKWHDEKLITTDDLIFTYSQAPEFAEVLIEKDDDLTVRFSLEQPFAPFLDLLTLELVPEHVWGNVSEEERKTHELNLKPIGSGSYRFDSIQISDGEVATLTVTATPGALPAPQYEKRTFVFVDSEVMLIKAFKLGEIDAFATTLHETADEFKGWKNALQTTATLQGTNRTLFFNLRDEDSPTQNVELRRTIYTALQSSEDFSVLSGPTPKNHWAYSQHATPSTQSEIGEHTFKLVVFGDRMEDSVAKLGESLPTVTFETRIITSLSQLSEEPYDMFLAEQQISYDPDQYIYWHSSRTNLEEGGLNISGYQNRRVDKALEDGRKFENRDERKKAYDIFQRWLAEEVPAIYLERPMLYYITRVNLEQPILQNLWFASDRLQ